MPSDERTPSPGPSRGEVDVLVATTVVEVGVDVPNASTMAILEADRFGVSQLHQPRRVGRGVPGLCLLVTEAPPARRSPARGCGRATLDGFELAEVDLGLRGEGDVLGDAQSGARSSPASACSEGCRSDRRSAGRRRRCSRGSRIDTASRIAEASNACRHGGARPRETLRVRYSAVKGADRLTHEQPDRRRPRIIRPADPRHLDVISRGIPL
jgi:hypothetical protein